MKQLHIDWSCCTTSPGVALGNYSVPNHKTFNGGRYRIRLTNFRLLDDFSDERIIVRFSQPNLEFEPFRLKDGAFPSFRESDDSPEGVNLNTHQYDFQILIGDDGKEELCSSKFEMTLEFERCQ